MRELPVAGHRHAGTKRIHARHPELLVTLDGLDRPHSLGVLDGTKIHSMLQSAKRKFNTILRDEVARTIDEPAEVDIEFAKIKEFLAA